MSDWAAELVVTTELARALIEEQFAPLPARSVELLAEGWDYTAYLVDGTWVFRFPRREVVVPGTQREIEVLGRLELPVAVPAPTHVGRPSTSFPWPFYGARHLPGGEAVGLDEAGRAGLAHQLARALRALHAPETDAAVGGLLPADPIRRADMERRVPRTRAALAAVADLWTQPPVVDDILASAAALPGAAPTAVVHGDLHFRQVLVEDGRLTGVVDWVDVCRSDPGVDLQLYWSLLSPGARPAFLEEYGAVGQASLLRARVLALLLNAILARYGRDEGRPEIEAEALAGLRRTVA